MLPSKLVRTRFVLAPSCRTFRCVTASHWPDPLVIAHSVRNALPYWSARRIFARGSPGPLFFLKFGWLERAELPRILLIGAILSHVLQPNKGTKRCKSKCLDALNKWRCIAYISMSFVFLATCSAEKESPPQRDYIGVEWLLFTVVVVLRGGVMIGNLNMAESCAWLLVLGSVLLCSLFKMLLPTLSLLVSICLRMYSNSNCWDESIKTATGPVK